MRVSIRLLRRGRLAIATVVLISGRSVVLRSAKVLALKSREQFVSSPTDSKLVGVGTAVVAVLHILHGIQVQNILTSSSVRLSLTSNSGR